ncbi:dentin sialophosphoprotein-like [Watersipora subatra]|uniref:dentin sialophosphoprotein-like n=1 Tax=Watersipora subatra TaxID=2589382 RepID=UPI00355BADA5
MSTSGSGIGTFCTPPLIRLFFDKLSYREAVMFTGLIALQMCVPVMLILPETYWRREKLTKRKSIVENRGHSHSNPAFVSDSQCEAREDNSLTIPTNADRGDKSNFSLTTPNPSSCCLAASTGDDLSPTLSFISTQVEINSSTSINRIRTDDSFIPTMVITSGSDSTGEAKRVNNFNTSTAATNRDDNPVSIIIRCNEAKSYSSAPVIIFDGSCTPSAVVSNQTNNSSLKDGETKYEDNPSHPSALLSDIPGYSNRVTVAADRADNSNSKTVVCDQKEISRLVTDTHNQCDNFNLGAVSNGVSCNSNLATISTDIANDSCLSSSDLSDNSNDSALSIDGDKMKNAAKTTTNRVDSCNSSNFSDNKEENIDPLVLAPEQEESLFIAEAATDGDENYHLKSDSLNKNRCMLNTATINKDANLDLANTVSNTDGNVNSTASASMANIKPCTRRATIGEDACFNPVIVRRDNCSNFEKAIHTEDSEWKCTSGTFSKDDNSNKADNLTVTTKDEENSNLTATHTKRVDNFTSATAEKDGVAYPTNTITSKEKKSSFTISAIENDKASRILTDSTKGNKNFSHYTSTSRRDDNSTSATVDAKRINGSELATVTGNKEDNSLSTLDETMKCHNFNSATAASRETSFTQPVAVAANNAEGVKISAGELSNDELTCTNTTLTMDSKSSSPSCVSTRAKEDDTLCPTMASCSRDLTDISHVPIDISDGQRSVEITENLQGSNLLPETIINQSAAFSHEFNKTGQCTNTALSSKQPPIEDIHHQRDEMSNTTQPAPSLRETLSLLISCRAYLLFVLSCFLATIGYSSIFVLLPVYAKECGIPKYHVSYALSAYGAIEVASRIVHATVANKKFTSALTHLGISLLLGGVGILPICIWGTAEALYVTCSVSGLAFACIMAFVPVVVLERIDKRYASIAVGVVYGADGLATPISYCISPMLYSRYNTWAAGLLLAAVTISTGSLFMLITGCIFPVSKRSTSR